MTPRSVRFGILEDDLCHFPPGHFQFFPRGSRTPTMAIPTGRFSSHPSTRVTRSSRSRFETLL